MASTTRPATPRRRNTLRLVALLGALIWPQAGRAQTEAQTDATVPTAGTQVMVVGTKTVAGIAGFGNLPLTSLPMQLDVTTAEQMKDLGIRRLSDIARIDAAVGDGYNAEGY